MSHVIRGSLRGLVCARGAAVAVHPALVRAYRARARAPLPDPETQAAPQALSADDAGAARELFLAEARTDAQGAFTLQIDDDRYQGEPVELHLYFDRGPQGKGEGAEPLQVALGTVSPEWQEGPGGGRLAYWHWVLPHRWWCWILRWFGVWVIWGRVVTCKEKIPVAQLTVRAYDADIFPVLRDYLGSAVTAGDGTFAIYFLASAFQKAPLGLPGELVKGPDYFFRVEDGSGNPLLDEPQSRARQSDRENRSNCFCVELCVETEGGGPFSQPWFTNVGNFQITTDIDAAGLTKYAKLGAGGVGWGFFAAPKLRGFCPKTSTANGQPMWYRFRFRNVTDGTPLQTIEAAMVVAHRVGSRLAWDAVNGFWAFQEIHVAPAGASGAPPADPATPYVLVPNSFGWIPVVQDALDDGYQELLRIDSTALVPGGAAPGNGAGNPVAAPRNGKVVEIVFQTTTNPGSDVQEYEQVQRATLLVNNWEEVRLLSVQEFELGTPCDKLTSTLTIKYTVDHQLLNNFSLSTSGPSGPLPSGNAPRGGNATVPVNISAWPTCAYSLSLSSRRSLTDGEGNDDQDQATIIFCK
jgi:hypothetical protein